MIITRIALFCFDSFTLFHVERTLWTMYEMVRTAGKQFLFNSHHHEVRPQWRKHNNKSFYDTAQWGVLRRINLTKTKEIISTKHVWNETNSCQFHKILDNHLFFPDQKKNTNENVVDVEVWKLCIAVFGSTGFRVTISAFIISFMLLMLATSLMFSVCSKKNRCIIFWLTNRNHGRKYFLYIYNNEARLITT